MTDTATKPERRRKRPRLNIWLPRKARPTHYCTVPKADGTICREPFYEGEDAQRIAHVVACAKENGDAIRAAWAEARPSAIFEPFDPEYAEWARIHGRPG